MKSLRRLLFCSAVLLADYAAAQSRVLWNLTGPDFAAPAVATVYGAPQPGPDTAFPSREFNGQDDGYAVALNPLAGWKGFIIRAKIRPAATGPEAQRFLHIEDEAGHRVTMELRRATDGTWTLDTFLKNAPHNLTLLDPKFRHSCAAWHTAELRFDGRIMSSWVDGKMELSGPVDFPPMGPGRSSLAVRLNRVSWYKGAIASFEFVESRIDHR